MAFTEPGNIVTTTKPEKFTTHDDSLDPEFLARSWLSATVSRYAVARLIQAGTGQEHIEALVMPLAEAQTKDSGLLIERVDNLIIRTGHSVMDMQELGQPVGINNWAQDNYGDELSERPEVGEFGDLVEISTRSSRGRFLRDKRAITGHFRTGMDRSEQLATYPQLLEDLNNTNYYNGKSGDFLPSDALLYRLNFRNRQRLGGYACTRYITKKSVAYTTDEKDTFNCSLISGYCYGSGGETYFIRPYHDMNDDMSNTSFGIRAVEHITPKR